MDMAAMARDISAAVDRLPLPYEARRKIEAEVMEVMDKIFAWKNYYRKPTIVIPLRYYSFTADVDVRFPQKDEPAMIFVIETNSPDESLWKKLDLYEAINYAAQRGVAAGEAVMTSGDEAIISRNGSMIVLSRLTDGDWKKIFPCSPKGQIRLKLGCRLV